MFQPFLSLRPGARFAIILLAWLAGAHPAAGQTGACCLGTVCLSRTLEACDSISGVFVGVAVTCTPSTCVPRACCPAGSPACVIEYASLCSAAGGTPQPQATCSPNPCPAEVCCSDTLACTLILPGAPCSGTRLSTTTCSPNPCPQELRACCEAIGVCSITRMLECTGLPLAAGTACVPNVCPSPCCAQNGTCTLVAPSACTGVPRAGITCGPDTCIVRACCTSTAACVLQSALFPCSGIQLSTTTCQPNACQPFSGSCCRAMGACSVSLLAGCIDGTFTQGQTCAVGVCPVPCCAPGGCSLLTPAACAALGGTSSSSSTCQPFECSGACCGATTRACIVLNFADCAAMGLRFMGPNATCGPNACPARGACCNGAACTVVDQSACTGNFLGHGVACAPASRTGHLNACCPADFNAAAGVSVQDLFDFLAAFFAGC